MFSVGIFHNILWAKYKGGVFSALSKVASEQGVPVFFVQIAETESDRVGLSNVDMSYHCYQHKLMFKGAYDNVPTWRLISSLTIEVLKSSADLIVLPGYHRPEYWAMLFACIVKRKKRAVFCDSTIFDRPSGLLKILAKRFFFRLCDGYFGYGLRSRAYLLSLGAKQDRIFHRCQAAALPHDYSPAIALENRIKNVTQLSSARFLYAGRISWEKGLGSLLSAFKLVLNELPDSRLVLVGSGPLRAELEGQCHSLGIFEKVEFTGGMPIENLAIEYAKATCFVLPSTSEPWGLVVNEALSYGCPVVVSNVCGCVPELVRTGVTGFDFEVGDARGLADCMLKVATEFVDHELVAKRCIELISHYSPERAAQQILDGSAAILKEQLV